MTNNSPFLNGWEKEKTQEGIPAYCTCTPTENLWENPKAESEEIPKEILSHIHKYNKLEIIIGVSLTLIAIIVPQTTIIKVISSIATIAILLVLHQSMRKNLKLVVTLIWPNKNEEKPPLPEHLLTKLFFQAQKDSTEEENLQHPKLIMPTKNSWITIEVKTKTGEILYRKTNPNPEEPKKAYIVNKHNKIIDTIKTTP